MLNKVDVTEVKKPAGSTSDIYHARQDKTEQLLYEYDTKQQGIA
ncbi:hypothetical protein VC555_19485 [Citrobacter freundii]|jgi:hypothetical protein|nr:hypothetical protein [Citrobacter freundii]MEB0657945.1 hypothetical protein [Citrobacter freundii]